MSRNVNLVETDFICKFCSEKLWFDGIGCRCLNRCCDLYNRIVLVKKGRFTVGVRK